MLSEPTRSILDVFEDVLQEDFNSILPANFSLDVPTVRRLAVRVREYYSGFSFPEKAIGEIRPYISPKFIAGQKLLGSYVQSFDPSNALEIFDFLKPYLLFSHSVCFHDPLPHLLDFYIQTGPDTEYELSKLHTVTHLLVEYAKIADLVRAGVVVPVSDEVWGTDALFPSSPDSAELSAILNSSDVISRLPRDELSETASLLGSLVKRQMWHRSQSRDRVDLYFPNEDFVPVYKALLDATLSRYSSEEIFKPFDVGVLANISRIDTSKIAIEDVLRVRSEEVFDDYRQVISGILCRLHSQEGNYSDFEAEFANAARQEMALHSARIHELTQRSNLLKSASNSVDRVIIGGLIGALPVSLAGDSQVAVGAAAAFAVASPIYEILREWLSNAHGARSRNSLRQHFLVLSPEV